MGIFALVTCFQADAFEIGTGQLIRAQLVRLRRLITGELKARHSPFPAFQFDCSLSGESGCGTQVALPRRVWKLNAPPRPAHFKAPKLFFFFVKNDSFPSPSNLGNEIQAGMEPMGNGGDDPMRYDALGML